MMIQVKSPREIALMRRAGNIAAAARELAGRMVAPGILTIEIDKAIQEYFKKMGAGASFLGYNGFPGSACISLNDEVIHGIPGRRRIKNGDIVKVDVGAVVEGFHGDCAETFIAGSVPQETLALIEATRQSFFEGIKYARKGFRVSDISHAIERYIKEKGYSVVKDFVGHGIGAKLHEAPEVPNYGVPGHGARLLPGMTLAIEPMVNMGTARIRILGDDWTVVTADGALSAHYENTVLITDGEPELLTVT